MSKSILVIDTPECCCQCKFSGADGDYCCLKEDMVSDSNSISEEEYLHKKPDWCPLLDLPEKMVEENRWFSEEYARGFNTCIDEILKGADGNE